MADKASRGLVIYGDGLMPLISPSYSNLHSLAFRASCGFLSLRDSPFTESKDERVVRELAQLLDVHDACTKRKEEHGDMWVQEKFSVPSISDRFMGMRAAFFTNCSSAGSLVRNLGFSVKGFDELIERGHTPDEPRLEVPDSFTTATELLRLLGFQEGKIIESGEFDLVFMHIGAAGDVKVLNDKNDTNIGIEWLDEVLGRLMQIAQPGSEISSRLYFSLVMSYGAVPDDEDHSSSTLINRGPTNSDLSFLFPHQSYIMKGGKLLTNIRHHHPMLIAQWQEAVTRMDMATMFSFEEFAKHGGNLVILADCFLHELAFKLWKAPKYGA